MFLIIRVTVANVVRFASLAVTTIVDRAAFVTPVTGLSVIESKGCFPAIPLQKIAIKMVELAHQPFDLHDSWAFVSGLALLVMGGAAYDDLCGHVCLGLTHVHCGSSFAVLCESSPQPVWEQQYLTECALRPDKE